MTDDDLRAMVRSLREFMAAEFDALGARLTSMEAVWANTARDAGHRISRVEERLLSLEARVARLEA